MAETLDFEVKFRAAGQGELTGFVAIYGGDADAVGDVIAPGAFTNTLAQLANEGRDLPMLKNHNPDAPIGKWVKLTDSEDGLTALGRFTLDSADGKDAYALAKDGAMTGLSIGYRPLQSEPRPGGGRLLTEIELVEISLVTFPANNRARVTDVKGDDATTQARKAAKKEAKKMADKQATELAAKLDKATDRIADLEAKAANINAAPKAANTNRAPEVKAFETYARAGQAGMTEIETKALQSAANAQGGFLVPEDFRAELLKAVTEFSPMRQVSRISNTSRDELVMPKRLTKLVGNWTAELAERDESEPTYGLIKIPVFELGVFTAISNQNLEDSAFDMGAELTSDFAESFGEMEAAAFISGDGVGKPKGILLDTDIPVTQSAAGGVLNADDLITAFYKTKAAYRGAGVWMMNSDTLAEVRKMKTSSGDYIWRESLADGQPPTILGRPLVEAPDMPSPATGAKAIIFGDMARAYRIVDRIDIAVLRDPYSLASKSAVRFHARRRVGGDVVMPEAARVLEVA